MSPQDNPELQEYFEKIIANQELLNQTRFKALEDKLIEHDRLTDIRFKDMVAQSDAALAAQDKAITKAEQSQQEYNIRSNEFRGQLDDQAKLLIPRIEAQATFKALEDKIEANKNEIHSVETAYLQITVHDRFYTEFKEWRDYVNSHMVDQKELEVIKADVDRLKGFQSAEVSRTETQHEVRVQNNWNLATTISVITSIVGWVILIVKLFWPTVKV